MKIVKLGGAMNWHIQRQQGLASSKSYCGDQLGGSAHGQSHHHLGGDQGPNITKVLGTKTTTLENITFALLHCFLLRFTWIDLIKLCQELWTI